MTVPPPPTVLDPASAPVVPWRNGAGTTRELATGAPDDGGVPAWRVSLADLTADAPFSAFPGTDRVFLPVDGELVLVVEGRVVEAPVGTPVRFAGEDEVTVRVVRPGHAVNLMVRRGGPRGDLCFAGARVGMPVAVVPLGTGTIEVHLDDGSPR